MKRLTILLTTLLPLAASAASYESNFPTTGSLYWTTPGNWSSADAPGTAPSGATDVVSIDHNTGGSNRNLFLDADLDLASISYSSDQLQFLNFSASGTNSEGVRLFTVGTFTKVKGAVQIAGVALKMNITHLVLDAAPGSVDIGAGKEMAEFKVTGTTSIGGKNAIIQNSTGGTVALGDLSIASGSLLWTSGRNRNGTVIVNSLAGAGQVVLQGANETNNTATRGDLLITSTSTTPALFTGILADGNSNGKLHLTKQGEGEQQLSNTNTYTGTTTLNAGRLTLTGSGSINATEKISLNGGELHTVSSTTVTAPIEWTSGTISGSGVIAAALTVGEGAVLAPGVGVGKQSFIGNQNWEIGGTLALQLSLADTGVSNQLNITGALDLSALSTGERFTISLSGFGSGDAFQPGQDAQWTIATATGGISLEEPIGDLFTFTGDDNFATLLEGFQIGLNTGGDGLVLHYQAIPEPGFWWAGAVGLGLGLLFRRKQHENA